MLPARQPFVAMSSDAPNVLTPIRIVVVDSQPIFRAGLRRLLEVEPRLRIVGETGDPLEAIALACERNADILLLGLSPHGSFDETLLGAAAAAASVRTIVLTGVVDPPEILSAQRLSASGVVLKDSSPDVLLASIESVMDGYCWVGDDRAADLANGLRRLVTARRHQRPFGLTARELEIVRGVVDGRTNRDIARQLGLSENTVKRHLCHIFDKVGASSKVELALFALHHQVLGRSLT